MYTGKTKTASKFFLLSYIFDDYYKYILSISFPSVLAYWFLSWYFTSLYNWIITWFIKLNSNKTNPPKNPPGTKHVCWLLTTQCYTICCLLELSRFYIFNRKIARDEKQFKRENRKSMEKDYTGFNLGILFQQILYLNRPSCNRIQNLNLQKHLHCSRVRERPWTDLSNIHPGVNSVDSTWIKIPQGETK